MIHILNIEPFGYSPKARSLLEEYGEVTVGPLTRRELLKAIPNYDIIIVRLSHQIDQEVINAGTRLKAIVSATTGLDHIDISYAEKNTIKVLSLQGENDFLKTIHATAEHTWALLLTLVRQIPNAFDSVKSGNWERDSFRGVELHGKTFGIVGLGRIGEKVAEYAKSFGMNVLAFTKHYRPSIRIKLVDSLKELFKSSDVISLHLPLNNETENIIGYEQLSSARPGTVLINTSRGEIINEEALVDSLKSGQLAGAAIDVIVDEKKFACGESSVLVDYAQKHKNLIITPHIGGATSESMEKTEIFMAAKLVTYIKEEILQNV